MTVVGLVVGAHLLTNAAHGVTHGLASVPLTDLQVTFVVGVVGVAPLVTFVLVLRGHAQIGVSLLAVSLAGSLCFGVAFHFLLPTPDHVHAVTGRWSVPFGVTATLAAVTDAVGIAIGVSLVNRSRKRTVSMGRRSTGRSD